MAQPSETRLVLNAIGVLKPRHQKESIGVWLGCNVAKLAILCTLLSLSAA